ncbi:hypothetical protein ACFQGW_13815 [Xanthomonas theicola]
MQRQPIAPLLALGLAFASGKQADHRTASAVFFGLFTMPKKGVFRGALQSRPGFIGNASRPTSLPQLGLPTWALRLFARR